MADSTYGFRSALGGFHKGDVTGFIEKTAAQHRSELLECEKTITALREENRSLQQQLNLLMMSTPLASAPAAEPEPAAEEPVAEPAAEPAAEPMSALMNQELLAYRRAEAVERNASNRARKVYRQVDALCAGAMDQFQATDAAVKQAVQTILDQASSMEQAYQALCDALDASREALSTMNDTLPQDE